MTNPTGEVVLTTKEDLQKLFDTAIHSMDFGSGFLDNDEVDVLRAFAEKLGLDPMVATPSNFKTQYPHTFEPKIQPHGGIDPKAKNYDWLITYYAQCAQCGKELLDGPHI